MIEAFRRGAKVWFCRLTLSSNVVAHHAVFLQFFVCGSSRVAAGAKETLLGFIKEYRQTDDEGALKVFGEILQDRYATDVFE